MYYMGIEKGRDRTQLKNWIHRICAFEIRIQILFNVKKNTQNPNRGAPEFNMWLG